MEINELIKKLKDSEYIKNNHFELARDIVHIYNESSDIDLKIAQELLLRALDQYENFQDSKIIIDDLIKELRLYPYLKDKKISFKNALVREAFTTKIGEEEIILHGPQAEVFSLLMSGKSVVLSAPTSFGKSLIIDAIVSSGKYSNIVIVVPTIALIDETRRRLNKKFSHKYKIITHSTQKILEKNIYVLTQERALENDFILDVDFFVIDEFYKLSLWSDNTERCALLNEVFYRLYKKCRQFYMLGPNIQGVIGEFNHDVNFEFRKYEFQTVVTEFHDLTVHQKEETLTSLCDKIEGQTLIFCSSPPRAYGIANILNDHLKLESSSEAIDLANWLAENYHPDWILVKSLKKGIGIHHARIPRSIAQYIVQLFNEQKIKYLICTSTLIEGVNTATKNIICYDNQISGKKIDYFTFNNIVGRSGRMFQHFIGEVYLLSPPPSETLPFVDIPVFSQGPDTPESLLISLDEEDLSDISRQRISQFLDQKEVSLETLQSNKSISLESQLRLAKVLHKNYYKWFNKLLWQGYPDYEQLLFICNIIWEFFDGKNIGNNSIKTPKQLTFKIRQLSRRIPLKNIIEDDLNYNSYYTADEVITRLLDFRRLWANFHFPRMLKAIESLVNDVQKKRGGSVFCEYTAYAILVENYFDSPSLVALEEYGLPLEIAKKFENQIIKSEDTLDTTIARLKFLKNGNLNLSSIEKRFISRVQTSI
ncbi:TPA: DEAD/DEAH box helicase [Acinetobacter baumannii]|nr:DEAD/DEAH box helicase [Acinetobacter baumannii]